MNAASSSPVVVNDVHSRLNPTPLRRLVTPRDVDELLAVFRDAPIVSVSGGRHAMGGQQFGTDTVGFDLRQLNRVIAMDAANGCIEVEAGIQWPELIAASLAAQGPAPRWGIAQKQTGADTLTLGGSLSANVHGRGLALRPIISDVESIQLLRPDGNVIRCSRTEHAELFRLAIGGYGLFGVIVSVRLNFVQRRKLRRVVEIVHVDNLMAGFDRRRREGCLYGDFQFSIDERSSDFLQRGVFSCYQAVDDQTPMTAGSALSAAAWLELLRLAYVDRSAVYERYCSYYLSTHGQTYWSDTHQLGPYLPDYAEQIAQLTGNSTPQSLVITELYVPPVALADFLRQAAEVIRRRQVVVIYGTVRLIEQDRESFMPWARANYACIIFNLLSPHDPAGAARTKSAFLDLIDLATSFNGCFYLTYHRHADRARVERCYPEFGEFLAQKRRYDPTERFQSDWYRHYSREFA